MDFVADALFDGRRLLTIADNCTRECLVIEVDGSLRGEHVVAALTRLAQHRRLPRYIKADNGSEFISKALDKWAYENGVLSGVRPREAACLLVTFTNPLTSPLLCFTLSGRCRSDIALNCLRAPVSAHSVEGAVSAVAHSAFGSTVNDVARTESSAPIDFTGASFKFHHMGYSSGHPGTWIAGPPS